MITITFTTSIVKTGKGRYIAHAQEFPVTSEPASTQRGAIKKLKVAVQSRLRQAAQRGTLTNVLGDARLCRRTAWSRQQNYASGQHS